MPKLHTQNCALRCADGQERAIFTVGKKQCDQINSTRTTQNEDQSAKHYIGFDRINRVLRHISFAIFKQNRTLVEVQACIVGGQLHLSSNAHSEKIVDALRDALKEGYSPSSTAPASRNPNRHVRAVESLNKFVHNKDYFEKTSKRILRDTSRDLPTPHFQEKTLGLLDTHQITMQAEKNLTDLHEILLKLVDGDASRIQVHAPPALPARHRLAKTVTMHAEQNIQQALASLYMTSEQISVNTIILSLVRRFPLLCLWKDGLYHALYAMKSRMNLKPDSLYCSILLTKN